MIALRSARAGIWYNIRACTERTQCPPRLAIERKTKMKCMYVAAVAAALASSVLFTGCEKKEPTLSEKMEQAGKDLSKAADKAAADTAKAADKAADEAGKAADSLAK